MSGEPPPSRKRSYALARSLAGVAEPEDTPPNTQASVEPAAYARIRPSVPARRRVEAVSQELLETTAESALLVADPDGGTSFEIAISDDLFKDVACLITVRDRRVVATFRVRDQDTRRLLEAEAGRLRVQLEERGLTVDEVRVERS